MLAGFEHGSVVVVLVVVDVAIVAVLVVGGSGHLLHNAGQFL